MKINFVDLKKQYLTIKDEINEAIQQVIEKSAFSSGFFVKEFEDNFARSQGAKYCAAVNSGTSALHVAMLALGIGRDDEVIVPTNTFFATPEAVSLCGAKPVFVDCDPLSMNIAISGIEKAITSKTRAIIVVHLYGQPGQLDELRTLATKHNLFLIEDCAQAHLAEFNGQPVGTFGRCGCFSFYPSKNLGAYGEGGAVLTNDMDLFSKITALRDHGSPQKYIHNFIGHNYRMDGIQGAVLNVKLKHLPEWTRRRRKNADLYRKYLKSTQNVIPPLEMPGCKHVYHLFVIRAVNRDKLKNYLETNGIQTGIHYPIPCHLQKAYDFLIQSGKNFSVSERYADEILSLPMYPELKEEEIHFVCRKIEEFYSQ